LIQHSLEYDKAAFTQSDTDCLTLNITVPNDANNTSDILPVFVFIHGGGFMVGSSAYPQYDMARFVHCGNPEVYIPMHSS
jgi:carboxylesterase type B